MTKFFFPLAFVACVFASAVSAEPTEREIRSAIDRAVSFYEKNASKHGGYVWRYSKDFSLSEGEAETGADTIWVQPPGTPTVGEAFLDAFEATGNKDYLEKAIVAGLALTKGRMRTGGWSYSIEFDEEKRKSLGYVNNPHFKPRAKGRKDNNNRTTLDDDTTTAAIRFLVRLDGALDGTNAEVRVAARDSADALVVAQRANGGWPQNWTHPMEPDSAPAAPRASFPESWSRKWLNDWPGKYYLNDDVAGQTIRTLLDAYDHFRDERYKQAAIRGGEFLQLARMPSPQPGWAQQYDADMHPCWDRKFEPPAISGHESQDAIEVLAELASRTGEMRFLDGLTESLNYLRESQIEPGKVARFYEMETNKPLYFTKDYKLTYDSTDVPDHYGFVFDFKAASLESKIRKVREGRSLRSSRPKADEVEQILGSLGSNGGWLSDRGMKGFRKASREGVYESDVFAKNVNTLARYLKPEIGKKH